jgi:hypothetical protein
VPISDAYIVQYLLDGTLAVPAEVHWREEDAEQTGYVALLEHVEVILEPAYSRAGSRLILRFRNDGEEFNICEPAQRGWLGRKFSKEDERDLAKLFSDLMSAVASQCARKRLYAAANQQEIRERISRRLLFGEPRETSKRTLIAERL